MPRIIIPPNQDWRLSQAEELLEAIDKLGYEGRGAWEIVFLSDMRDLIEHHQGLTDGQLNKLSELYRRASQ